MAEQVLSAQVNIEVDGATQRLKVLEAQMERLQKVIASSSVTGAKFDRVLGLIKKTGSEITGLKKLTEQMTPLSKSTGQATQALGNLNRVVQDAPFGIIGVANNIDPLVQSFIALKASTGSAIGALGSMFSALAGPTGILFAFSAVSSAATVLVQKYGSLGNAYDVLTGKTAALSDEQKKFAEDQHNSEVGVEKQRVNLEALVKVAQGDIGTKKQQAAALAELNKLIPDNIGLLTAQNIKTAEGTAILKKFTEATINQAEAELLAGRAAELRVKLREKDKTLGQTLTQELRDANKAQQQLASGASVGSALSGVVAVTKATQINTKAVIEGSEAFKSYMKDYKELAEITNRIASLTAGSIELSIPDPKKLKDKVQKIKEDVEAEFKSFDKVLATPEIVVLPSGIEIQDGLKKLNSFVQSSIDTEAATRTYNVPANIVIKPNAIDKTMKKLNDSIHAAIAQFETDAFAGIGEAIGKGITSGASGIAEAGIAIGNMFGNFLKQLGKILIQTGVLALAAKKALATLFENPYTAIAVGVGLTALGSIVTSKLSATKFANGGIITGPTLGMVGEAGQPEVILPLSKINQFLEGGGGGGGGELSARVSGGDLLFVLNKAQRQNNRLF